MHGCIFFTPCAHAPQGVAFPSCFVVHSCSTSLIYLTCRFSQVCQCALGGMMSRLMNSTLIGVLYKVLSSFALSLAFSAALIVRDMLIPTKGFGVACFL